MGESELVLDNLSVEDALRLLGAGNPVPGGSADWRATLKQAGATPGDAAPVKPPPRQTQPPAREHEPAPEARNAPAVDPMRKRGAFEPPRAQPQSTAAPTGAPPNGLVVGNSSRELFGAQQQPQYGTLDEIARAVSSCTKCALHKGARNAVPGEGSPNAALMCVGEAPGATEDETGRPFVGQAGQLLTKILAAIDLKREDVFIGNVLKHRPPGNRNPLPDEVRACSPYLIRQIELIRPKVILALGTFAAQTLLETKLTIGKLRGQVHRYYGVPLIVTYHPAALLRNPSWKRPTWEDVQLARRILDDTIARG